MKSKYINSLIALIIGFTISSCKKQIATPEEPDPPSKERTEVQLLIDSTYYYYKLYSYWEEHIPQYDNIADYTDDNKLETVSAVLQKLKLTTPKFAPYYSTGGTYDRFSFYESLDWGLSSTASRVKMDRNEGYGIYFSFGAINDSTAYPIVNMVERGSPADLAGINRSDILLTLHDTLDMMTPVICDAAGCKAKNPTQYSKITNAIENLPYTSSAKMEVMHTDSSTTKYSLQYTNYEIDPLLADTIFEFPNHNVGYFAYSSFEQIENGNINQVNIDNIFSNFANKNIKSLIIDLRYNGGGYVDAATYIADKIINSTGKDQLMLSYELNEYLSRNKNSARSSFRDVHFKKNNNLEIEKICFLVTKQTASASEMLINVLKPYMDIKIIAEESSTYGKPVGYFGTNIMNKINLWVTSFRLLNAQGEADYWVGIPADRTGISDYIFVDFAKQEEEMIAEALISLGINPPSPLARRNNARPTSTNKLKINNITTPPHKGALKQEL